MSCNKQPDRFTITRGVENIFTFTIKGNNTTLPITLTPTDTFTVELRNLSDGEVVPDVTFTVAKLTPAESGRVSVSISAADTDKLTTNRGPEEDRYYSKPNYSLILNCKTEANGNFIAKVPYVYVD